MKILFYDVQEFEQDLILTHITNNLDVNFFKTPLNSTTYVEEKNNNAEAISCFVSSNLDKKTLNKFSNLKYIFLRCTGYSNVDLEYCKEKSIKVYNVPKYGNSTVAEYIFGLLLNLERKIFQSKNSITKGEINRSSLIGTELNSKTIGIIGAGSIGRKTINIAHGFDMDVLIYDPNPKGAHHFVELNELLEKSDYIAITCPLTSETKNLINRNTLSKMKKTSVLINVARGEIVDSKALYEALIKKKIKGACLDVIECEEYLCENHQNCLKHQEQNELCLKKYFFIQKLTQLENVIVTPHNAYNTKEAIKKIIKITFENIKQTQHENSGAKNLILL